MHEAFHEAMVHSQKQRYKEAVESYAKALAFAEGMEAGSQERVQAECAIQGNMGNVYTKLGLHEEV